MAEKKPLLFMCLAGNSQDGRVQVNTIKDQSWWQEAAGPKCVAMAEDAARMCRGDADHKDVVTLQAFEAASAVDYTSPMATLTACQLVDPTRVPPPALSWEMLQSTSTN